MHRFLLILLLSFPIFGEEINDPFEDLNRDIFIFNEKLDEKFFFDILYDNCLKINIVLK